VLHTFFGMSTPKILIKKKTLEGMANPMDTPSAREALYWAPRHQAHGEWDWLANLVECLKFPLTCSQRETSPPVDACKWDLDAAASTLKSRAQAGLHATVLRSPFRSVAVAVAASQGPCHILNNFKIILKFKII